MRRQKRMIETETDLLEYLDHRIAEVEKRLTILKNHKEREMRFPLSMRRQPFLLFITEEEMKCAPLLEELKRIKGIIGS